MTDRFASADDLVAEHATIEAQLADPAIHGDSGKARQLGKRYAQLGPIVAGYKRWRAAHEDLLAARELAKEDESFAGELPQLESEEAQAAQALEELLLPRDYGNQSRSRR